MSNGVGKNTPLHPCLACRCLVEIPPLVTLLDTPVFPYLNALFYTDTPQIVKYPKIGTLNTILN